MQNWFVLFFIIISYPLDVKAENLLDIYEFSRINDPQLQSASAQKDAAIEGVSVQRSELLPNIEVIGNYGRGKLTRNTTDSSSDISNIKDFTLSLSMPIYRKDLWIKIEEAKLQVKRENIRLASAQQALILRVTTRYFDILSAIDNLRFIKQEKLALSHQFKKIKTEARLESANIIAQYEAQTSFDRISAEEITAKNQLDRAQMRLTEITNSQYQYLNPLTLQIPLLEPKPNNIEHWVKKTEENNLEILLQLLNVDIAQKSYETDKSRHYPELSLSLKHNYNESPNFFGIKSSEEQTALLEFKIPLFQGGRTVSKTRQSQHILRSIRKKLIQVKREEISRTKNYFLLVISNIKQIKALEQSVASSRKSLENNQLGLKIGTHNEQDVLNATSNMYRVQRELFQARYQYIINNLNLKESVGQLSVSDLHVINETMFDNK